MPEPVLLGSIGLPGNAGGCSTAVYELPPCGVPLSDYGSLTGKQPLYFRIAADEPDASVADIYYFRFLQAAED